MNFTLNSSSSNLYYTIYITYIPILVTCINFIQWVYSTRFNKRNEGSYNSIESRTGLHQSPFSCLTGRYWRMQSSFHPLLFSTVWNKQQRIDVYSTKDFIWSKCSKETKKKFKTCHNIFTAYKNEFKSETKITKRIAVLTYHTCNFFTFNKIYM